MSESTALVPASADALPVPALTGDQITQAVLAYRDVQIALDRAMADCIIEIEGRRFRTKPYWRGLTVAYAVEVEAIEERREVAGTFADGRDNFGYVVLYRATTKSGRGMTGDGACFAIEKAPRFKCPHAVEGRPNWSAHFPHETCPDFDPDFRWLTQPPQATEHNVRSHAHTRAFNRAVSNLVGFGEVSAEEVDRDAHDPTPAARRSTPAPSGGRGGTVISEPQRRRLWVIAKQHGWTEDEVKARIARHGFDHDRDITRDAYDGICGELEIGIDGRSEGR